MFELIISCSYYLFYFILDFILYILVDIVVKTCLKEASDEQEKRVIWLWESALLACLCFFISLCHHFPWLLMCLSLLTFLYTQLLGRINFRYWWWQLATRWDEFEQHEESMEVYHSRNINPPNVSVQPGQNAPFMMSQPQWHAPPPHNQQMPPIMTQQMTFQSDPNTPPQAEPWYPSDSPNSMKKQPVQIFIPKNNEVRFRGPNVERSPYTPVMPRGQELTRKPIHGSTNKSLGISSRLKATFMSAIGMGQTSPSPPGLQNSGQNTCFMNAVLQCLAHSPQLASSFDPKVKSDLTDSQRPLVNAFADVLGQLNSEPDLWETARTLSLVDLRRAASLSNPSLVVNPSGKMKQGQQDAAEFLMWLLDALHYALNCHAPHSTSTGDEGEQNSSFSRPRFTAWTLRMLKYIYGDLTPQRIQELKLSCRSEIERANGLDNASYAEPIQRLSDLEWLTYKERNMSLLDDLFTGQMVEAQHCTACNRISVTIQTFNILPVPIVGPRQISGIVNLDDCFAKFGTIEELYGPDGLHCDGCNRGFQAEQSSTPLRRPDLSNGVMSPIPNNSSDLMSDSSVNDNLFKTSTPIRGVPLPRAGFKVTDGQRRSLLRQLPECLVVQLLRFSFHQGQPRKVYRPVSIPLTNLDLTGLIIDNVMKREDLTALHAGFQYNLYGLVLHLGGESTCYGHYVAYVLAANHLWYKFDDQIVTEVNMEYELNTKQVRENAYLLFYKKNNVATP